MSNTNNTLATTKVSDASGGSELLSQIQKYYQVVTINDATIILDVSDELKAGIGTVAGKDYSGKELHIYAEDLYLSKEFHLKQGVISAHQIYVVIEKNDTSYSQGIYTAGEDGKSGLHNLGSKTSSGSTTLINGENGKNGGNLNLYTEKINLENVDSNNAIVPTLYIQANGGEGGDGGKGADNTNGGNGGNGGDGGEVNVVVVQAMLQLEKQLVGIYKESDLDNKKQLLQTFITSIENEASMSSLYKMLNDALTQHPDSAEQLNETVRDVGMKLNNMAIDWREHLVANIHVSGGKYGVYGTGKLNGTDGNDGTEGTKSVTQVSDVNSLQTQTWETFMFAHPAQCSMGLEKAKRLYFGIGDDPGTNSKIVSNLVHLLNRLKDRLEIFTKLDADSKLATYYADNESKIGALNSVESMKCTYNSVVNLTNLIGQGVDYYGYGSRHVPLASYAFYNQNMRESLANLKTIEDYRNGYFASLATTENQITTIKGMRTQQEDIIQDTEASGKKEKYLISVADGAAKVIDSYQTILPQKKKDLLNALKKLKDDVGEYFDFNLQDLVGEASTLAFAPESKFMWLTLGAQAGLKSTQNITDSKGYSVNKSYMVNQITTISGSISSIQEGYSVQSSGTVKSDDPGANILLAQEDNLDNAMSGFYDKFPKDMDNVKKQFQDYIKAVTDRNNHILTYNSAVVLMQNRAQVRASAKQKISTLDDEALAAMGTNWPELTSFVLQTYNDGRDSAMEALYLLAKSHRFWALDDNILFEAYGSNSFVEINTSVLGEAQRRISDKYGNNIEKFGTNPVPFPTYPLKERGIIITADEFALSTFQSMNMCIIRIPVAQKGTSKAENHFAGAANIRITKVRAWVNGAKTKDNELQVTITQQGKEEIVDQSNSIYHFEHVPKTVNFKYNLEAYNKLGANAEACSLISTITQDGNLVEASNEEEDIYTLIGPFAGWLVSVDSNWNIEPDMSNVTSLELEFHGTNLPFK